jgi:hypothetical protein
MHCHKEHTYEIWKPFYLPFKRYGQWKSFCRQTNRHVSRRTGHNPYASNISIRRYKKWHRVIILRGYFFFTIYTEKNYPKAINSTKKGVVFQRRILTEGSHLYVEKWLPSQYSTGATSFHYTGHVFDPIGSICSFAKSAAIRGKNHESFGS